MKVFKVTQRKRKTLIYGYISFILLLRFITGVTEQSVLDALKESRQMIWYDEPGTTFSMLIASFVPYVSDKLLLAMNCITLVIATLSAKRTSTIPTLPIQVQILVTEI